MILPSASPVSWLLALAAAAAYASSAAASSRLSTAAARNVLLLAWVLHAAVLAWGLWGDTPRFGFLIFHANMKCTTGDAGESDHEIAKEVPLVP